MKELMKNLKWALGGAAVVMMVMVAVSCGQSPDRIITIPPGYVGLELTPDGWAKELKGPGQYDIGRLGWTDSMGSSMVLLDLSSVTVKESFLRENNTAEGDHRCMTQLEPVSVDVRYQMVGPNWLKEPERVKALFALVPPLDTKNPRLKVVPISGRPDAIYERFMQSHIRSSVNAEVRSYEDYAALAAAAAATTNLPYGVFGEHLKLAAIHIAKDALVPLDFIAVSPSKVQPDASMVEAMVARHAQVYAAETRRQELAKLGEALKDYPQLQPIRELEEFSKVMGQAGKVGHTVFLSLDQMAPAAFGSAAIVRDGLRNQSQAGN